jgi:hypothetical protein
VHPAYEKLSFVEKRTHRKPRFELVVQHLQIILEDFHTVL